MLLTTHAVLGAFLAKTVASTHPVLAFFVGLGSHFLTDLIPHGDSGLYKGYVSGSRVRRAVAFVVIDGLIALYWAMWLLNGHVATEQHLAISWGIFGGVLPDLLVALYEMTRATPLRWFHRVHFFFHNLISGRRGDIGLWTGVGLQATILFCIWRFGF
jgi:hypothetical protein